MKAPVLLLLIQLIGEAHAETGPITDHITTMSTVPVGYEGDAHLATDGDLDTKVLVGTHYNSDDGSYRSELKAALDGVFCIEKIKINFRKDMVYEFSCEGNGDCTGTNPDGSWVTYVTTVALEGDVDSSLYKACEIGAMGNTFGVHTADMASLDIYEWVPVGIEAGEQSHTILILDILKHQVLKLPKTKTKKIGCFFCFLKKSDIMT